MKTENSTTAPNNDPIWASNVDLLPPEECLPIIGSCQVSSILQNLDTNHQENLQNLDLIIVQADSEYKLPLEAPLNLHANNYIVLKESEVASAPKEVELSEVSPTRHYDKECFEDMLYFVCNLCPYLCTKETKITEHLEGVHKNKTVSKLVQLKCPACANIFYHRASLKSHLLHDHCVASGDLNLIVQAVIFYSNKEEVKNKNKVISAKKQDTSSNPLKCSYCDVSFADSKKTEYHIKCHTNEGFKCPECTTTFVLWKSLTPHLWRQHKVDMGLFGCDQCDYKTTSEAKLQSVHKPSHSQLKTHQCDLCNKSFKNQKQLKSHRKIHNRTLNEDLLVICEECKKSFPDKGRLTAHMNAVHKKLKPYLCKFCGYKASRKSSLRMHERSHTGEKPFACDQCEYSTSDHNSLRRHKLRHSGQKHYKCPYCSYACIQSSTYKDHLRTKHPGMEKDLMFTCFFCTFRTINKDLYNSHLVTVHSQKPNS